MRAIIAEYSELMNDFVDGILPVTQFEKDYLRKFKDESRPMDDQTFEILCRIFCEVDAYTDDSKAIMTRPLDFISAHQLKVCVVTALADLRTVK